ncbi:MAG TPA: transcriptional coactivator p15/PC4 family protein [Pseudobacteroides sp.]|nr:transcriptional coactivator p15/PC4 family protein [Pseudobacteroides sp.]
MADFWDKEELIGKLSKNSREEIQIKVVEKNDKKYIDIRTFWFDSNADEFKPSQKGVAIPYDSLDELKNFINSIG